MEVPKGTRKVINSYENKPRSTIREKVKKGLRRAVIGLGLGAVTFGAYELGREKNEGPKKPATGIEKSIGKPKKVERKKVGADNSFEVKSRSGEKEVIVGDRKIRVNGLPETKEEWDFFKFIFKKIDKSIIEKIQEASSTRGKMEPNTVIKDSLTKYFSILNAYREGMAGVRFSPGLIDSLKSARAEVKTFNAEKEKLENEINQLSKKLSKSKEEKSELVLKKQRLENLKKVIESKRERVLQIIEVVKKEKAEKTVENIAEYSAIMLTTIERALGNGGLFQATIPQVILADSAFSWTTDEIEVEYNVVYKRKTGLVTESKTFEESKFPMPESKKPNDKNVIRMALDDVTETFNFQTLWTINRLYEIHINGKTPEQASKSLRQEITKCKSIGEGEIPRNIVYYNLLRMMPDQDGKFDKFTMDITSESTRSRLADVKKQIENGSLKAIEIGKHIFYGKKSRD